MIVAHDVKFIFKTKAKRNVLELFNHYSINHMREIDLVESENGLWLPININKWVDIDTSESLELALKVLCKLTNPKSGRPGLSLAAIVVGYDDRRKLNFVFTTQFINGKHTVIGYYENGQEMIYQDTIILTGNENINKFNDLYPL